MVRSKAYERIAWEDRFNRPSVSGLRAGLVGSIKIFDQLRRHLLSLDGVSESFAWHGDCWRWTIEYHTEHSPEPLAVIVPSPDDLQLAVPLERDFVRNLSTRRMKRSVKEGIGLAQDPFDTHWGIWSVSDTLIDDLGDLVELKLTHQVKQVG